MKKLLFIAVFFMGAMLFGSLKVQAVEDECTPSIEESGAIITVTVCNRKTSFLGAMTGLTCDVSSTTQCVFFNYNPE